MVHAEAGSYRGRGNPGVTGGVHMDKQSDLKLTDIGFVVCDICMKEIPASEVGSCEAADYVIHYWGLECYDKWRRQKPAGTKPVSS